MRLRTEFKIERENNKYVIYGRCRLCPWSGWQLCTAKSNIDSVFDFIREVMTENSGNRCRTDRIREWTRDVVTLIDVGVWLNVESPGQVVWPALIWNAKKWLEIFPDYERWLSEK